MNIFFIILSSLLVFLFCKYIFEFISRKEQKKIQIHLDANLFIEIIKNTIEDKKYNLLEERRRLKKIDAYGNENLSRWIGNPPLNEIEIKRTLFEENTKLKEGIPYFWKVVLLKNFVDVESFFKKWDCYRRINPLIEDEIQGLKRKLNRDDWYVFIASLIEKSCKSISDSNNPRERDHNYRKGLKFENKCLEILKLKGWRVEQTSITGDQGVDLIASIKDLRICIQCKDHIKAIGNKAVQEISAGKIYWKGTHAVLVSRSGFTQSATKLARANKVLLISEEELKNIEKLILLNKI